MFLSKHKAYKDNGQHDTQEFCRILLNDFNLELNKANNKHSYMQIHYTEKN